MWKKKCPRKAFLSWNGTEQRSSHLLTDTQNKSMKPRCSRTPFTAVTAQCWEAECGPWGGRSWVGLLTVGVETTSVMLSKICWAEGDFRFSLFFSFQKLKWYKANFRNTSLRLPVTGNSASRCLAILVQHQDWGPSEGCCGAAGRELRCTCCCRRLG